MEKRTPIVLMTREPETEKAVAAALASSEVLAPDTICRSMAELKSRLEERTAPAVLIDIDPQPLVLLREMDVLIGRSSPTRFIVLSGELRNDLVLEAMQAGARHFLVKSVIPRELVPVLERLVAANEAANPEGQGSIVTILSAGGGCGATTLAVNLADELRLLASERVLLIDLDATYGSAATYLGLGGRYGISDVLSGSSRIDEELIASTAVAHSPDLHLLLSPVTANFSRPAPLAFEGLDPALRACRGAYPFTVVDAPRVSMDVAATLASASCLTLVVLQLSVKDIRVAREMIAALEERGGAPKRVLPLVNRYRKKRKMITLEEARKALGVEPLVFANDFKGSLRAVNYGQLLSRASRRSPLSKDLRKLAARIAKAAKVKAAVKG